MATLYHRKPDIVLLNKHEEKHFLPDRSQLEVIIEPKEKKIVNYKDLTYKILKV